MVRIVSVSPDLRGDFSFECIGDTNDVREDRLEEVREPEVVFVPKRVTKGKVMVLK